MICSLWKFCSLVHGSKYSRERCQIDPLQNHWLLELWTKYTSKFEVEKFNGTNKIFGMWQCEVMDVLNS